MARSRAVITVATFAMLLTLRCAPGMRPTGGTFDAGNAVSLKHEILLLIFLTVSVAGGFAYVIGTRPEAPPP